MNTDHLAIIKNPQCDLACFGIILLITGANIWFALWSFKNMK